jgi:membrane protease YdiL (CAAX protease family)
MTRQAMTFILIAYLITWVIVLGLYFLYKGDIISISRLNTYSSLGAFGPFLSSVICCRIFYKKAGLRRLFKQLKIEEAPAYSLLLSLSPLFLLLIGYVLYPVLSNQWFTFEITKEQFQLNTTASYIAWALPFVAYSLLEEFGWRGFLLPHFQEKFTAFRSTLVLAGVWATWHLPFFLFRFQFEPGMVIGFLLGIFVGTIVLTSIFNSSGGSLLACIIFHLSNNIASAFDKRYIVATVSTGLTVIAVWLLIKYGPRNLSGRARVRNYFKSPPD